ncbi:MAG: CPBP family intramembrane metalloprotease [Bacteroidales bacterium]|nr:CPBP family intramembrane metalloprotease [Bacteroidales bacterium]
MRQTFVNMGFWGRSLTLLFLMVAFTIIFVVIGDILAVLIFGKDDMVHATVPVLQFLQGSISLGLFVLPAAALCFMCGRGTVAERMGISPRPRILSIIICVGIMLVSMPLVSYLEELNLRMVLPESMKAVEDWMRAKEADAAALTQKLIDSPSLSTYAANLLILALMPAVGEELTFRMGLQRTILSETTPIPKYWTAIITAVIFSAIHLQFFGFVPRMVLGFFLGLMLLYTRGAICSVVAHFFNNAFAVTSAMLAARGVKSNIDPYLEHPLVIILSGVATVALFVLLHRYEKKVAK